MVKNFMDDEPVAVNNQVDTGVVSADFISGKIAARFFNKPDAPLGKTEFTAVVQLLGSETGSERCGVDIVTILDVSGSMEGLKMEKLKTSMKYLIKKLSPVDRLSVVTFSRKTNRLCPLLLMNEDAQAKVEKLIDSLRASGGTNITGGLTLGLQVLAERRQKEGRSAAIMLMSDGIQSDGYDDPRTVQAGAIPVHTFGLGNEHDVEVLQGIATSSNKNGTYSVADVEGADSASLNIAFSACLAGLLNVVVEDLVLTITKIDCEFKDVRAGSYNKVTEDDTVTISFGNLYKTEKRKATIDLYLPAVNSRVSSDILQVSFSFRPSGETEVYEANPIFATVTRTAGPVSPELIEVVEEGAREETGDKMKEAREKADANDLDGAKSTLKDAEKSLANLDRETSELIKALKYDVQEFFKLLKDPKTYKEQGRAFALSAELSYGLQRFAARGDATQLLALAIPLAVVFAKEAREFDKDPTIKVRTAEEDKKEEAEIIKVIEEAIAAEAPKVENPVAAQAEAINLHLSQAIESLKALQEIILSLCSKKI